MGSVGWQQTKNFLSPALRTYEKLDGEIIIDYTAYFDGAWSKRYWPHSQNGIVSAISTTNNKTADLQTSKNCKDY